MQKIKLPLILLLLLTAKLSFAQHDFSQFYPIRNLISNELIKGVSKDKEGFIWIATDDGVLRYDGYQTQLFYKEIPTQYTKGFLRTKTGRLILLHDLGIKEIIQKNDSLFFSPLIIGDKVYDEQLDYPKAAYEDQSGNIWIGEMSSIVRYNANGKKHYEFGESLRSIDYHRSFSFAEDAFGNLWIAPFKGPLLFYNKGDGTIKQINYYKPFTQVKGITCVKGDYLLVGGKEGIMQIKIDSDHTILEQSLNETIKDITIIKAIGQADVYVGTAAMGLYHFEFGNFTSSIKRFDNVPFNDILDLYFDSEKEELWVAGSENIGLFKPSILETLNNVGENRIETMTTDKENGVYYSIGKKVYYISDLLSKPKQILSEEYTYFDRIYSEGSKLWIGDAFGRVYYYDVVTHAEKEFLEGNDVSIRHLFRDSLGSKWFAGHSRGLIRIDAEEKLKIYQDVQQSVLIRESNGGKVFCGRHGKENLISIYDSKKDIFTNIPLTFDFACPDNIQLNDFQFDDTDNLWIATDEGLLNIENENGQYKTVRKVKITGLNANDPARAIAIDGEHIIFANTQGLIISKNDEYILFNQDSGLPSKIVKERGLEFDHNGNLLIGTAKGMAVLKKEAIQFRQTISPVFKSIQINGDHFSLESTKHLFPFNSKVEAEFISLAFPASNLLYQTRIKGLDEDWSDPSGNRNINILSFSEGDYTIQVRAREDGKLWSVPVEFSFSIMKPWYRKWWSFVLFVGLAVVTIVIATNVHNNNLIRQKKNLQRIIEKRTEEINKQKNELIEQQKKIIHQKEEIIEKNEAVLRSQQALNEADSNYHLLKEKQLQDEIDYRNKQITTHTLNILQKNEMLQQLKNQLEDIVKNISKVSVSDLKKTLKTIDDSFKLDKDWEDFKLYFEQIHSGFYSKLKLTYPDLTPLELRHCALIRLNLNLSECASILGISNDSIKVSRTRLRKKLNLDPSQGLSDFIISF